MTFWEILETLIIGPLKLIFELIFQYANNIVGHPGWAIVVLSVIVNILLMPLYRRADIMQKQAQLIETKLKDGVSHIKKTFSGDERMMILQAYYRQNHYKPTDALKGSISLLLEIPFFMAAYQFLSRLNIFENVSFGPIPNLGATDGLLLIGGVAVNVLPIIMTIINIASSCIYLKGATVKSKAQVYALALIFLVLLYNSPACLVLYWTLNNVFSLVKNIVLNIFSDKQLFHKTEKNACKKAVPQPNSKLFVHGMLFITLLTGILIPSAYIAASPQEYVNISCFFNPLWYIVSSAFYAIGLFLIWLNVFYRLATARVKVIMETFFWICCGNMLVNYMFFGRNLGIISSRLIYPDGLLFSDKEMVWNIGTTWIFSTILYYIISNWRKHVKNILLVASVSFATMVVVNVVTIKSSLDELVIDNGVATTNIPEFQLSKEGNNVVIIMLDRAMGAYVPYIFNEKPELKEQFEGFTHYSNTISFGRTTNFTTPALLGGYEYTPVELNKRNTETLASKQNEALKVMPVIFMENGYDVTVCDPPYANYQWIPDVSIYDKYPEISAYITQGKFLDDTQKEDIIKANKRNFFYFSLMKSMPIDWQASIYDQGNYNRMSVKNENNYSVQKRITKSSAEGISYEFMESYNALLNLPNMTTISEDNTNTFLFMSNRATHEPTLLQTPDYVPEFEVNNVEYDAAHSDRFVVNGQKMNVVNSMQMEHYHINMAAFIQLGKWFDYLRENDVYDNTRIILVADHGRACGNFSELIFKGTESKYDGCAYYPLLMIKDFNSHEFTTSTEFMTNADVPTLAMEEIIDNPRNPFTQKEINSDEKYAHEQYIIISDAWSVRSNNGNTFLPARWASVKENIWDANNWEFCEEEIVLQEHKLP